MSEPNVKKGMIVKIDGDTTKLSVALDEVNKKAETLVLRLKEAEKIANRLLENNLKKIIE